jgi:hypothetical protein
MHAKTNETDFNHSPSVGIMHVVGIIVSWAAASWRRLVLHTLTHDIQNSCKPDNYLKQAAPLPSTTRLPHNDEPLNTSNISVRATQQTTAKCLINCYILLHHPRLNM